MMLASRKAAMLTVLVATVFVVSHGMNTFCGCIDAVASIAGSVHPAPILSGC